MRKGSKVEYGAIAAIVLAALAVVVAVWCARDGVRDSRADAGVPRHGYLKGAGSAGGARAEAQKVARREVSRHGRRATVDQRKRADAIVSRKIGRPKGPKAFFDAARFARARANGTWRAQELPNGKFTADEREILDVADQAVSDRDMETAKDVAAAALKSKDARVRLRAVEVLTEFGEAGLPEMADFLADPHAEVANLAADRFDLGVQEIANEAERVAVAKLGMLTISDEDQLRALGGTLIMASDALLVVQALADVIRDGTEAQRSAAKDAYESQTGEEWGGEDAAEKWLQENYIPPEPEETAPEDCENEGEQE